MGVSSGLPKARVYLAIVLASLAVMLAVPCVAAADNEPITGYVVGADTGLGIEGATVQLFSIEDGIYVDSTTTDANGYFALASQGAVGAYRLDVSPGPYYYYTNHWFTYDGTDPAVTVYVTPTPGIKGGLYDSYSGALIPNLGVVYDYWWSGTELQLVDWTYTDAVGRYAFQYPEPDVGQHYIVGSVPGYNYYGQGAWVWYDGDNDAYADFFLDPSEDGFEDDDDVASARSLSLGETQQARSVVPGGDEDWIAIDVEAGRTYFVETWDPIGCSGLDNEMYLYDSDGETELAYNDDLGSLFAGIRFTADETETLYVMVRGLYPETVGPYAIAFSETYPAISGKVTAKDTGDPLWGIEVDAYCYDGSAEEWWVVDWGVTDESGDYTIYDLPPDSYKVGFFDYLIEDGYYDSQFWHGAATLEDADVIEYAGTEVTGVDAVLAPATPGITGTVTSETWGLPLACIEVTAYYWDEFNGWVPASFGWTDENGDYALYDFPWDGDFRVGFADGESWDGYYTAEFYNDAADLDSADDVHVIDGSTTAGIDAALADGVPSITGVVTAQDTGDPLGDIEVDAYFYYPDDDAWYVWDFAVTDYDDGGYALYGLGDGPDSILAEEAPDAVIARASGWRIGFTDWNAWDGYYETQYYDGASSIEDATDVYTSSGSTVEGIDAALAPGEPSITGNVRDAATDIGLPDMEVAVYAYDEYDEFWYEVSSAWTDENGDYGIYALDPRPAGPVYGYRVEFRDTVPEDGMYSSEFFDDAADIESATDVYVEEGATTSDIDAALSPATRAISGTVTDEDFGEPLPDIGVSLFAYSGSEGWYETAWTSTGADGGYAFYDLPAFDSILGGDSVDYMPGYRVGFFDYWTEDGYYETEFYDDAPDVESADDILYDGVTEITGIDAALAICEPDIFGMVTDEGTGEPIDGAGVTLWRYDGTEWWDCGWTMTWAGYYELYGVDPGIYKVTYSAYGYESYESPEFEYDGLEPYELSATLAPATPDLSGHVRNANTSAPVRGAYVELYRWTGKWEFWTAAETDASGAYRFFGVVPGAYQMRVNADGYLEWVSGNLTFEAAPLVQDALLQIDYAPSDTSQPVYGGSRYSTAVEVAEEGFDPAGDGSWPDVDDIVIASGDDRAAADPLAASGLCWAYDAPLFLVSSTRVPDEVKAAVKEITDANGTVNVHVVGGKVSVPDARFAELNAYTGGKLVKDRIVSSGTRYDLAAAIAYRMADLEGPPETVLIANGADPTKFFDALALSPISARNGFPILLVAYDNVPLATDNALEELWPERVIVGGGPKTVSKSVVQYLGAERWSSDTRYSTAATIANKAMAEGWLGDRVAGVAAKLPDALTGGSAVGRMNGVLLLTRSDTLPAETANWIKAHQGNIEHCYVFGGPVSVTPAVRTAINNCLK